MLKFFQKLKARKGFTLVELIVVIAIIGVLAAILIPTMLGYVTKSRVTSANSTAASIKNNIDTFLTNADTAGYGMKQGKAVNQVLHIQVFNNGGATSSWSCTAAASSNFKSGASVSWNNTANGCTKDDQKSQIHAAEGLLAVELANLFPEMKNAAIYALLNGGKCVGVAFTADQTAQLAPGTDMPDISTAANGPWAFSPTYHWDNNTAGVTSSGIIVGTAPAIPIN